MKLLSWNVNGIRAVIRKGFSDFVEEYAPDVLCLQETKARPEQVELPLQLGAYRSYWNSAEKAGYSGTAVFTKEQPMEVTLGMGMAEHDAEGRVLALEYPGFHLVTVYTPNSQDGLRRLAYRQKWDRDFRNYLKQKEAGGKPVVFCGDLNVAHQELDLARPEANRRSAGFTDEERAGFSTLLNEGFVDTYRHLHPEQAEAYTWWSYRGGARARNVGWRIDYFGVSECLTERFHRATILSEVLGSDHCPVGLEID